MLGPYWRTLLGGAHHGYEISGNLDQICESPGLNQVPYTLTVYGISNISNSTLLVLDAVYVTWCYTLPRKNK